MFPKTTKRPKFAASRKPEKEFLSEDKFKKTRQFGDRPKVNRQETKHGKLDLPRFHPKGKKK